MIDYKQKAKEIHDQSKAMGRWDVPDPCVYGSLQLISTDIARATEGEHKGISDRYPPYRKMGEAGLADGLIRTLDLGSYYDWEVQENISDLPCFAGSVMSIAGRHLFINVGLSELAENVHSGGARGSPAVDYCYTRLIYAFENAARARGYDIHAAMDEKIADNKTRPKPRPGALPPWESDFQPWSNKRYRKD